VIDQIGQWLLVNSQIIANTIQTLAVLITIVFTYIQLRRSDQSNRALIELELTSAHREIWKLMLENPQLVLNSLEFAS
jgi:hypothetical protein